MKLIIPSFNQPTYLKQLILWWRFYGGGDVYVIDNASTSLQLDEYYENLPEYVHLKRCHENDARKNLREFLENMENCKYVISDPDIMIHPTTPLNFLEVMSNIIDMGFHHVGFNLITNDIPLWTANRDDIIRNEYENLNNHPPVPFEFNGKTYEGRKSPIDTTFAMYEKTDTQIGWYEMMSGEDWSNSIRIFDSIHLQWYVDGEFVNPEMDEYYKTCKRHITGEPSAGLNNNRPLSYE